MLKPKHALVSIKLHGLKINTRPKHIDFKLMILFSLLRVTSH
jgi:hypothetical protein